MKRIFAIFAVIALLALPAGPAFAGHSGGDDCNSANQQAGVLNNTNVLGSQQNQQGSCNVQQDNDVGGLIGDIL
jgi:hypothetical protein